MLFTMLRVCAMMHSSMYHVRHDSTISEIYTFLAKKLKIQSTKFKAIFGFWVLSRISRDGFRACPGYVILLLALFICSCASSSKTNKRTGKEAEPAPAKRPVTATPAVDYDE